MTPARLEAIAQLRDQGVIAARDARKWVRSEHVTDEAWDIVRHLEAALSCDKPDPAPVGPDQPDRDSAVRVLKRLASELDATEKEMEAEERRARRQEDIQRNASGVLSGRGARWLVDAYAAAIQLLADLSDPLDDSQLKYLARVVAEVAQDAYGSDREAVADRSAARFQDQWPRIVAARRFRETSHALAMEIPRPRNRLRAEIVRLIEVAERIEQEIVAANAAHELAEEAAALAAARERRWKRMTLAVSVVLGVPGVLAALHALGVY